MNVFDIDTGALVGGFKACEGPEALEYHPLRDEMWVRCGDLDVNGTDPTHLDVLSASNPSGEIQTNILLQERALREGLSSSGHSIIHPDLGDVGYLTDDAIPDLFEMNLSTKDIVDRIPLSPASHGLSTALFSPVNQHAFIRAEMCCSCGTADSDLEACGRRETDTGYPVSPTTGNHA